MFEAAKKEAPAIIFIDEIDSVGRTRGSGVGGGHDEREQTLNQILSEMDGFAPEHTVVVLAATNRPDVLDPALLRPGRFDRKITLELPLKDARRKVLEVHSRNVPLADDVDLESLASRTAGFSGADLENLINEAALLTGREKKDKVTAFILDKARDKIVLGAERENILNDEEKERVAFHEAGHALMACLLDHADPVSKVTIIPRGRALGATEQLPEEERANLPQSYLQDRIAVMLGGRVSEKIVFNEFSSGAEDDIKQATRLARHMVGQWGMSEKLGPVAFRRGEEHIFLGREMAQQRDFSEHTARLIDDEVRKLVCGLEQTAHRLLTENRGKLDQLAQALQEKEILDAKEVLKIVRPDFNS
jgi:cell division protease FtsH